MNIKRLFFVFIVLIVSATCDVSAQDAKNKMLDVELLQPEKLMFYSPQTPEIRFVAKNTANSLVSQQITLQIDTDKKIRLYSLSQQVTVNANDSAMFSFSFTLPNPGFYRCSLWLSGAVGSRKFNIGYEPEAIVSLLDSQPDFDEFWQTTLGELAAVAPEYTLIALPEHSSGKRKMYRVTMKSFGNVEIAGYYCVPTAQGKHPVIVSYMGYGSKPWMPDADGNPDHAEFVLSVRGQGLNEFSNIYGDWITYGLQSKEAYYYRGAFMDLIRAIDFVASREEVDVRNIFVEGGSQGGAFSLIACALDNRIAAAAPFIPFLSDYPDYFDIVDWPANSIRKKQAEMEISDKQLYETLSYFDVKNFARRITCPIIMGVGLQDEVCPPHTNFAGYNLIRSPKEYHIFPLSGHDVGPEWWQYRSTFLKKYRK